MDILQAIMAPKLHVSGPLPGHKHTHTIIFLHGNFSNPEKCSRKLLESEISAALAPQENGDRTLQAQFPSVRWVFPSGPALRHSQRLGCLEHTWFDMRKIKDPQEDFHLQFKGVSWSVSRLKALIAAEEAILDRQKIFLAGIGQGFAIATTAALSMEGSFAGIIGLSTWKPVGASKTISREGPAGPGTRPARSLEPVFLGGLKRHDLVIRWKNKRILRDNMAGCVFKSMEWNKYEAEDQWIMQPKGVDAIVIFIRFNMRLSS
ncbi:hypothetical protein E8E14_002816 [Neopestalotiopsis sp. 37M]|nr:hypothetical protein E8E14_002816 [Neopestalotiopsis sp. 37M]